MYHRNKATPTPKGTYTFQMILGYSKRSDLVLDEASVELDGYEVEKFFTVGYAPDEILKKAEEGNYDLIIMTKSTKKGLMRMIGSVTSKVIKNSKISVIVLP